MVKVIPLKIHFFGFSEARVTVLTCQWLMGTCTVNSVDLLDGTICESGVILLHIDPTFFSCNIRKYYVLKPGFINKCCLVGWSFFV